MTVSKATKKVVPLPSSKNGQNRVYNLADVIESVTQAGESFELATDAGTFTIPPREIWPDAVFIELEAGHIVAAAGALLAEPVDPEERTAVHEAKTFLRSLLADGPKPAKAVRKAAEDAGVTERTLKRAKASLGVESYQEPGEAHGGWSWRLGQGAKPDTPSGRGPLTPGEERFEQIVADLGGVVIEEGSA